MFISRNRLKNIERHLQDLEDKQFEQGELIEFLTKYDKDAIVAETEYQKLQSKNYWEYASAYGNPHICIKYVSDKKLRTISTGLCSSMKISNVEKVDDDIYILHFEDVDTREDWRCKDKFIQLDKTSNKIMDITDIKARYENQEKVSENLKESAQALGEAFKGIFGSCTKNECKCKKSSADKTKKQETAPKTKSRKNTKKEEK